MLLEVVALAGEPATGKTSLMKLLVQELAQYPSLEFTFQHPELDARRTGPVAGRKIRLEEQDTIVYLLGKYRWPGVDTEDKNFFEGTDRLSMTALGSCLELCKHLHSSPKKCRIVFEGDRFFREKFFSYLEELGVEYTIYALQCNEEVLQKRRAARGERNQSEVFLKGRRTMVRNLCTKFSTRVVQLENNSETELSSCYRTLRDRVLGCSIPENTPR